MDVLFATQKGYVKKVKVKDFRVSHRGGVGVRTIPADERNGLVVGIVAIKPESNILLIDTSGKIIRLSPAEVRTMGRQARGVRLIRLDKDQKLISVVAFEEQDGGDTTDQEDESNNNETKLVPKKADEEVKAQTNSDEQLTIN